MGRLTDDMLQLWQHIDRSRESRLAQQNTRMSEVRQQIADFAAARTLDGIKNANTRAAFVNHNTTKVNRLLNDCRRSRQVMAQQGRETRATFVSELSKQTSALLAGFNAERENMAKREAQRRADFIAHLSNEVVSSAQDTKQNRSAAKTVFSGTSTSKKKLTLQAV